MNHRKGYSVQSVFIIWEFTIWEENSYKQKHNILSPATGIGDSHKNKPVYVKYLYEV